MATLDPVKLGEFPDDPNSDDANVAFAKINENERLLNEEVRPVATGGTGATNAAGAKQSLGLHHFTQDEGATSVYAPEGDSRVVVTKTGWSVWSSDPNFDPALPLTSGGTGGGTLQEAQANLGITSKVEKGTSFRDAFGGPLDYYLENGTDAETPNAFTSCADFPVGSRILVSLNKGYSDTPDLDGAYTYIETKATYNIPGRLQIAHGYLNGRMAVRASGTNYGPYAAWNYLYSSADIIPVSNGGTGSNGPWGARYNIGALGVGDYGLGSWTSPISSAIPERSGVYANSDNSGEFPYGAYMVAKYSSYEYGLAIGVRSLGLGQLGYVVKDQTWGGFRIVRDTSNTTVDGNGFIKAASPVGDLYADRIELNEEAQKQPIVFEKLGVGDYLIKGSTGFALEGWYVEQPKDSNGNVYHAVNYMSLDNGDLSIKTYAKKLNAVGEVEADLTQPMDIKENRFISVRFNSLPEDLMAPINPAITDDEGNAAPTKYHTLEEGIWIISEEDTAKLEQERLAAMQPLKRRQFRLALAMNGFDLKEVEALIETIEDPMKRTIAQIEWQDATDFERTNPSLLMMAELMQLTTEQVDQLWSYGLSL